MNHQGVNKAKVFLKKIGLISTRLNARERAKMVLQAHIERLKKNPTKTGLEKLPNLINTALQKETDLARNNLIDSNRVQSLKEVINLLTQKNLLIEDEISILKDELVKQGSNTKTKNSSPKNIIYHKKVRLLENKYLILSKQKNVNPEQLKIIKNRIKRIKSSL